MKKPNNYLKDSSLISIAEAKKAMGGTHGMSEKEIQELIYNFTVIARRYIGEAM